MTVTAAAVTSQRQQLPLLLQSLAEECFKASIYAALTVHAVNSALTTSSSSTVSILVHSLVAIVSGWALLSELYFLILVRPKLPPGSLGCLPWFGDIFVLATRYRGGLLPMSYDKAKMYGSAVYINMVLGRALVTLGDSDSIAWLWNQDRKSLTESSWPPNIQALLGPTAVANLQGRQHKTMRRVMEPFYTAGFVGSNYLDVMTKTTDEDLEEWCCSCHQNEGWLSGEVFKLYSLRLFMVSTFGHVDKEIIQTLHDDYKEWISGFLTLTGTLRVSGWTFDRAMKARDRIMATIDTLMKLFLEENPEDSERAKNTVMGRMIYSKDYNGVGLSTEEIKDNLLNLIFAGHDTTYASINTVLHHVSQHPEVEAALVEEVSKFQEPLDLAEIKNAPVLNAIMHESWRVDPPVGFSFRKSVKKTLDYQNYSFPKGTTFSYNIGLAVQQENLYPSAKSFHMERFLPREHPLANTEWESKVDPHQGRADYPIFGGGSHVCLGKNFAKLELRIIMARLYKYYHVAVRNNRKVYIPVNGWAVEFQLQKRVCNS